VDSFRPSAHEAPAATLRRALASTPTPTDLTRLQRAVGNQAVHSLVTRTGRSIQAKLMVGPVGDSYEQEADRVAEQVVNMPTPQHPAAQREAEEEEALQMKPLVQRQPEEEEELQMKPLVQRQAEEEEELQMKPLVQREADEQELRMKPLVQRQAEAEGSQTEPPAQQAGTSQEMQIALALQEIEFVDILKDPILRASFAAFAKNEWSLENLLVWDDIQSFKKSPSRKKAQRIYKTYLTDDSPRQVNTDRSKVKPIETALDKGNVDADTFKEIEKDAQQNMSDTYSRWKEVKENKTLLLEYLADRSKSAFKARRFFKRQTMKVKQWLDKWRKKKEEEPAAPS
jgi:hypothetical protein